MKNVNKYLCTAFKHTDYTKDPLAYVTQLSRQLKVSKAMVRIAIQQLNHPQDKLPAPLSVRPRKAGGQFSGISRTDQVEDLTNLANVLSIKGPVECKEILRDCQSLAAQVGYTTASDVVVGKKVVKTNMKYCNFRAAGEWRPYVTRRTKLLSMLTSLRSIILKINSYMYHLCIILKSDILLT